MPFWAGSVPASLVLNVVAVVWSPWMPWFGLIAGLPLAFTAFLSSELSNSRGWAVAALVLWLGDFLALYLAARLGAIPTGT